MRMSGARAIFLALLLLALHASVVVADSIAFRLGKLAPRVDSVLWDENLETFTLERRDFDGLIGGVEVAVELSEFVDVVVGVETASRTLLTNYRDFVRDDGSEILQDLSLRVTPVTFGARFLPFGKLHRVFPYVSGGAGLYVYEYREEGEFIDFDTFEVFGDVFLDRGVSLGGFLAGGVEVGLTRGLSAFGEYRRHWASGEHGDDFEGFGEFDLRAREIGFGVHVRF